MQYITSIALVIITAAICFVTVHFIGYRVVALILLMVVSFIAMIFEILPVLLSAMLSAIVWNFFFIPPIYTFHIYNAEDVLMFLLYFTIALVNAVLTFKIRKAEKNARDKEEKEKTIKLYNTLLNSLSHELRTPLSTILGAVDSLKENKNIISPENQNQLLIEIDKASIRLNRQVENLLNMSRLESGMLKPKNDWCDINELINHIIQKLNIDKNHTIDFIPTENLPLCKLDAGITEQIIHNLLHNAIQYTPPKSIIKVETKMELQNCVIIVSDNGNGFSENQINLVFDKFYRLPNSKAGGSGLGLSIVKGFVEALNGSVHLENNSSGGAKFTIKIPTETSFINHLKNE